ncbi:MAG: phosphatidate cytidylyltransferase [Clostridia bacterium]|nr:phosphatidate cytidylyltransferase [Clostridia bacterium]
MAIRTISAFIALPFFFVVVYLLPPVYLTVFVALIALVSVYELLWRSKIVTEKALVCVGYIMALAVVLWAHFGYNSKFVLPAVFLLALLLFVIWMIKQKSIEFKQVTATIFGSTVIPLFLSSILGIMSSSNGIYLIIVPFMAAWITDTGAYFTGYFLGKHKLAPTISPKKTVEGAIGGVIVCVLSFIIYGFIMEKCFLLDANYLVLAIAGLVLSPIAQIGDLSLSIIKREYNIKDYGVIFPGHGGILDRFDSVLFTAPATLIILNFITLIA